MIQIKASLHGVKGNWGRDRMVQPCSPAPVARSLSDTRTVVWYPGLLVSVRPDNPG